MKKTILTVAFALSLVGSVFATSLVIVVPYTGESMNFDDARSLVFGKDTMSVEGSSKPYSATYSTVRSVVFDESDAVVEVKDDSKSDYSLYPNPAQDEVTVANLENGDRVELYTMRGTLLVSFEATESEQKLDITALPKGVYFVRIQNKYGLKLIKK